MSLTFTLYGAAILSSFALLVRYLVPMIRQQWRQRNSDSWPWAKISVDESEVEVAFRGKYGEARGFSVNIGYSYAVDGQRYSGTYHSPLFDSERQAKDFLEGLQGLRPPARYQPHKPEKSVLDPFRDAALGLRQ